MKIYSAECISDKTKRYCGIFSTMNLAISEVIHRNNFRTDLPSIEIDHGEAQVIYEGNDDFNCTEYLIEEHELNKWED